MNLPAKMPAPTGLRLAPEMASFKLLVLRFVRAYIEENGASPSYGEIANALNTNRKRVRNSVLKLAAEGLLQRRSGERGLSLPDAEAAALRRLRELGWIIEEHARLVARGVTIHALSTSQVLDYHLPHDEGGPGGQQENGKAPRPRQG